MYLLLNLVDVGPHGFRLAVLFVVSGDDRLLRNQSSLVYTPSSARFHHVKPPWLRGERPVSEGKS